MIHVGDLEGKSKDELLVVAQDLGVENGTALTSLRREEVLQRVMQSCSDHQGLVAGEVLPGAHEEWVECEPVADPAS